MGHPIVAIWVLLGTAILLALGSGAKDGTVGSEGASIAAQSGSIQADADDKSSKLAAESSVKNEESVITPVLESAKEVIGGVANKKPVLATAPLKSALDNRKADNGSVIALVNKNANVETKGTATTDISQITGEEMLLMAREAYWNNGLDEAAQIYKKLIEKEPKVLEHKGELGNVYWRQGYPKKAAELYSEIALPMIENGGTERVANMIGFIGLFYPDRAAEIHQKMQSKKSK
jgi:hypothetical protein